MLGARQTRFYVYEVDVWRTDKSDLTKDAQPYTRVYQNLRCKYNGHPDSAIGSVLGRTRHDITITLDTFDFDLSIDGQDGDLITMVTGPGGFNLGQWWSSQGNVQTLGFHANVARILAQQIPKPDFADAYYAAP